MTPEQLERARQTLESLPAPTPGELASFVLNVVQGVANKTKLPITAFPPELSVVLLQLRKAGILSNSKILEFLRNHARYVHEELERMTLRPETRLAAIALLPQFFQPTRRWTIEEKDVGGMLGGYPRWIGHDGCYSETDPVNFKTWDSEEALRQSEDWAKVQHNPDYRIHSFQTHWRQPKVEAVQEVLLQMLREAT